MLANQIQNYRKWGRISEYKEPFEQTSSKSNDIKKFGADVEKTNRIIKNSYNKLCRNTAEDMKEQNQPELQFIYLNQGIWKSHYPSCIKAFLLKKKSRKFFKRIGKWKTLQKVFSRKKNKSFSVNTNFTTNYWSFYRRLSTTEKLLRITKTLSEGHLWYF